MSQVTYESPRPVRTRIGMVNVSAPVADKIEELLGGVQTLTAAFHAAIRSPQGVVPAGFEDFYQPGFDTTKGDKG